LKPGLILQISHRAIKLKLCLFQIIEEFASELPRQNLHWDKKLLPCVHLVASSQAAAGHNIVKVKMMHQVLPLGMKDPCETICAPE